MLNCFVTLVHGVGRNNICCKPANRATDVEGKNAKLLDMQTHWGHKPKERLTCFNACSMFFLAMLAGLIKYTSSFMFGAEGEQEPVRVIRSSLH